MALKAGTRAPDFTLRSAPRETVSLHDRLDTGRTVVLLFFPLAFSSVCTAEMCTVRDDYGKYDALNADVFAISVDSPYTNQKFAAETGAKFPILSDFNKEAIRAYDVLRPDLGGLKEVAERAAFVIAPSEEIVYAWQGEPGMMPPFEEIRAAVSESRDS